MQGQACLPLQLTLFVSCWMLVCKQRKVKLKKLYKELKAKLNGGDNAPTCECGMKMVLRNGKKGDFYGCSAYPQCRNTKELNEGKETEVSVEKTPLS